MAGQDNVSHRQLALYMTAKELNNIPMGDAPGYASHDQLVNEKLSESKREGLYDSIKHEGVQDPVHVHNDDEGQYLWDGHHRVVSAHDINPSMLIPVEHHEY